MKFQMALLWVLVMIGISTVFATTFESDTTALLAISKGWSTGFGWSGDPCADNWKGVTCEQIQNSNVTKLILNNLNINGRLLQSVGDLQNLITLDLSFNPKLAGPLPKSLGNLKNLVTLNLQSCGFTGSIPPELGQLKNLNFLALNMNSLSGSIPPELGGLAALTWFDLAQNNGISGTLPISSDNQKNVGLNNLTTAKHFHLNNNSLSGSFPKEITSLPNLIHLLLDSNLFTGEIPDEIGNFSRLQILRIDNNGFSGPVPSTISQIGTLTEIHGRNNKFSGALPDLSGLSKLKLLIIGENSFDLQSVPSFTKLSNLQTLEINNGNLGGPVSPDLFKLPALESVSLTDNHINGSVDFGGASSSISDVELDNNNITSIILGPRFTVSLAGNPACTDSRLNLSPEVCTDKNTGSWVSSSGKVSSCRQKTCSDQKVLNPNTCGCASPLVVIMQFTAPAFSLLDDNKMNRLRANLSQGLNISTDQIWTVSANFTTSHRLIVSIDFFPLTGDALTPEQVSAIINEISTHQIASFMDDFGPYALFAPPIAPIQVAGKSSGMSLGAIVGIGVGAVLLLLAILAVGVYAMRQKKRADKAVVSSNPFASWGSRGKDSGTAPQLKGARFFTLAELKKATNNFSSSNLLGVGGYGKVYRGTLITGEEAAIKRAEEGSLQGGTEFKTEIELLSRVHHRNLVGLIGFCYEQGEQMLVYEYMPRGTIREHLSEHSEVLNWRKRLEIAVGSARGIAYLHDLADPPIIHRDIKSSNILLDEKLVAKVADFGLSKLASEESGKGHVSTQVKGTLGYLDPEYYMTQQLTNKSDVYSFGIVLLELVTARQPIENNKYIVREVRGALDKGGFSHLVYLLDPTLGDYPRRDLEKFVELALRCVEESASKRPTMSEVVKELEILLANVSSSGFSRDSSVEATGIYHDPAHLPKSQDPKFQYSGGFPVKLEPK